MLAAIVFWLFMLATCLLAFWLGGRYERTAAMLILMSALASSVAYSNFGWINGQVFVFFIDTILLAAIFYITSKSMALWPIWFAGFHMISVATGFANLLFPTHVPEMYRMIAGFWALPAQICMALGIILDHRVDLGAAAVTSR
jgi:hypothetical protein